MKLSEWLGNRPPFIRELTDAIEYMHWFSFKEDDHIEICLGLLNLGNDIWVMSQYFGNRS